MATETVGVLPTVDEIKEFFFRGMLAGWVSGATPAPALGMPGFFDFVYNCGPFRLVDRFCVRECSCLTSGTTTIWHNELPVWCMSYGGYYLEEAIPFLKEVLHTAYTHHIFMGGRGIMTEQPGGFRYVNRPRLTDFAHFGGCEEMLKGTERIGYHNYHGMSL